MLGLPCMAPACISPPINLSQQPEFTSERLCLSWISWGGDTRTSVHQIQSASDVLKPSGSSVRIQSSSGESQRHTEGVVISTMTGQTQGQIWHLGKGSEADPPWSLSVNRSTVFHQEELLPSALIPAPRIHLYFEGMHTGHTLWLTTFLLSPE